MRTDAAEARQATTRLRTPLITDADTLGKVVTTDRLRIYEYLAKHGPSRVGEVASGLGLAIGSVSFHLRVLDEAEFVERADEFAPDRRSSYWRAVPGGIRFALATDSNDPGYAGAVASAEAVLSRRRAEMIARWRQNQEAWSLEWREAAAELDSMLRLSPRQTADFVAEVSDVIRRWKATEPSDDQETVFVALNCFPVHNDGQLGGESELAT